MDYFECVTTQTRNAESSPLHHEYLAEHHSSKTQKEKAAKFRAKSQADPRNYPDDCALPHLTIVDGGTISFDNFKTPARADSRQAAAKADANVHPGTSQARSDGAAATGGQGAAGKSGHSANDAGSPPTSGDKSHEAEQHSPDVKPERTAEEAKVFDELQKDFGVKATKDGDKYRYTLPNCNNMEVAQSDATKEGLDSIHVRMQQLARGKMGELEGKYNVHFAPGGTEIKFNDKTAQTRQPRLDELYAIEAGLQKSWPSTASQDKRPMEIVSTDQHVFGYGASYWSEFQGKPTLLMETPPAEHEHGMLESDARAENPRALGHTLEAQIEHELGHNSQHKAGWDTKQEELAHEAGWENLHNNNPNDQWIIRGKNGAFYRPKIADDGTRAESWYRCDKNGNAVDDAGKRVDKPITFPVIKGSGEVEQMAEVGYPNPCEMQADGFKFFRMDADRRGQLLKHNQVFYDQIKRLDQEEIDRTYGGAGKKVRLPSGDIGDSNEANRELIKQFEQNKLGF